MAKILLCKNLKGEWVPAWEHLREICRRDPKWRPISELTDDELAAKKAENKEALRKMYMR